MVISLPQYRRGKTPGKYGYGGGVAEDVGDGIGFTFGAMNALFGGKLHRRYVDLWCANPWLINRTL